MTNDLLHDYRAVRRHTLRLAEPLSEEDCCVQSMPDASPVKWHLAHTSWFFETFLLERFESDFRPFHPAFRVLFNSYYNGIGEKHPRPQRGLLTRPSLGDVLAYRRNVDERMAELLSQCPDAPMLHGLVVMGLHHEQQHQELMLTDIKHLLSMNPLRPAYMHRGNRQSVYAKPEVQLEWRSVDAGVVNVGHTGGSFCFDNELPRHRQFVEDYALATRLVNNDEYLAFVEDGAYANPALWLSEGWDWLMANGITQPLYWWRHEDGWNEFSLYGMLPIDGQGPVTHLSFFEADAYARWAGARLPSEAEWEHAARNANDFGTEGLHPAAPQVAQTGGGDGLLQLFGSNWQWTLSSYAPYPGYHTQEGAIGEYNGKFMANQYVLRGSSCVTPAGHARATYRNFFPATARWQFSGIRLAKSI